MKTWLKYLVILLILQQHLCMKGQVLEQSGFFELLESIQEDYPEMEIDQEQMEQFTRMLERPLNLNTASKDDLQHIPFLNERLIENLHYYIYLNGPLLSIYELKAVPGFKSELLKLLVPFLDVETDDIQHEKINAWLNDDLLIRASTILEKEKGFRDGIALGSPYAYLVKNKMTYGKYAWISTLEKDIGERYWYNKRPEYISSALSYEGTNIVRKLIVGDFKLHMGEGLIQASNVFNRKSSMVMNVRSNGDALRSSTSADGTWFKRGAGIDLVYKRWNLLLYASMLKADAAVYDEETEHAYFKSLRNGGYRRTLLEIDKRDAIGVREFGGSLRYAFRKSRIAINATQLSYDVPMLQNNIFIHDWLNLSANGRGVVGPAQWWFETAIDKEMHMSHLVGCDLFPDKVLGLALVGRYFSKDYYATSGYAFSESGEPSNEAGFYLGLLMNPLPNLSVKTYVDLFHFPGPRYNVSIPSTGWEGFVQADGTLGEIQYLAKLKYEEKQRDYAYGTVYPIYINKKYDYKLSFIYDLGPLRLKSTLQAVNHHFVSNDDWGWLIYQDIKTTFFQERINLTVRAAFFNSPSYETRLYAYENDVLYAFSVPAYYGEGLRYFLNLSFKTNRKLTAYLKIGHTLYSDRDLISSGFSEIEGSHKTDFKVQLRYRF